MYEPVPEQPQPHRRLPMHVEQDAMRACVTCVGSVHFDAGALGCARNFILGQEGARADVLRALGHRSGGCPLPRLVAAVKSEAAESGGIEALCRAATPEWMAEYRGAEGALLPLVAAALVDTP